MTTFRALFLAILLAQPARLFAQTPDARPGRIVGRIIDESGNPVPGAQVGIAMSVAVATTAGIDGRYTLLNVPAGPVALSARAIGFSPKTVSGVNVPEGGVVSQNIVLSAQTVQVGEIIVSAAAERGSVSAALEEQRNSNTVVNSVTSEQMARTPDADAAQAVQRVSGVTVQDGRYVFVRGLGERYTTTSLNNTRLPSPEPERRMVPLDLFPSNLLEGITTTKTFTADQPGDFSGGQVNLRTREFPARRTFSLSTSTSINSAVTGFAAGFAPGSGSEWRVSAGPDRQMPQSVRGAPADLGGLSDPQISGLIGDFRNVWGAEAGKAGPGGSLAMSLGGEDPVFGVPVGYLFSMAYSTGTELRRDEQRAGIQGDTLTQIPVNVFRGMTATSSVLMGGIANLTLRLGTSKLSFNNTLTRSGDNSATRVAGLSEEFGELFDVTRLAYVARSVLSSQLQGQHLLGLRNQVEWTVTRSHVSRDEPDRSDLIYEADTTGGTVTPLRWWGQQRSGVRTFGELDETSLDLAAGWRLELGESPQTALKVGVARRGVDRDSDTRSYFIRNGTSNGLSDTERAAAPEQIFAQPDRLMMVADAAAGRYTADDAVLAGFLQAELPFGSRLRAIAGVRVERWALDLTTLTPSLASVAVSRRNTDVLPSLSLTYGLSRDQNLRFAASQTLSRPEYREIAPIGTRDIIGGYDFFGNAAVQRALIRNVDVRWEWYPRGGEVVSIGLFAKLFDHPIERVLQATVGATAIRPENTKSARNLGIELEFRRNLAMLTPSLLPFSVFANVTLMASQIRLEDSSSAAQRNEPRALTGQAPYVVNAGLAWQHPRAEANATLLYNVVGRRITEVGTTLFPDVYEEARHMLDLSVRFPIAGSLSGKFDARNLLDAPYEHTQGTVTRLRYRVGRGFSLGLSWTP